MKVGATNSDERVRQAPRLSVNSLSEYLTANASRRRRILEEQKRPRSFQVAYYKEAEEAVTDFILADFDPAALKEKQEELSSVRPRNEWDATRLSAVTEAIASARTLPKKLDLKHYHLSKGPQSPKRWEVGNVSVSVRPEILLQERGSDNYGAVKLFFSKSKLLAEDRARYIGTIVYQYLRARAVKDITVAYKHCFVLDVFGGQVFRAPRTYKRRSQDIEASCDEISRLWAFV